MKQIFILFISLTLFKTTIAQDTTVINSQSTVNVEVNASRSDSPVDKYPYKTSFKKDAPIIAAGLGLTLLGVKLINDKDTLTSAELATKTIDKIPSFDRGNAGYYSDKINDDSYLPFYASFAMPVAMLLLNGNERRNALPILVMYMESLSITGALFTLSAGSIHRSRPMVYTNENGTSQATLRERRKSNNQRSFFAGHTAASATGTFFAAKVFSDLNPNSALRPVVWGVAAAIPAVVGYMRYKSGHHFLSDNLLGYVIGAASGILIPEWHKSGRHKNISFSPQIGKDYKGFSFVYNMK